MLSARNPSSPLLICLFALAACGGAACSTGRPAPDRPSAHPLEQVSSELNRFLATPYSDTHSLDVLYVTNREPGSDPSACGDKAYGVNPGSEIHYGICRVNTPKRHTVGLIEPADSPRADSHRYFRTVSHSAENQESLKQALLSRPIPEILVFIHGFNVRFEEAVFRAAQIAYDLKFQGSVILFSWPAGAKAGFLESTLINRTYATNRENAKNSIPAATEFLKFLATLDARTHVLVHSMGHQVLIPALAEAARATGKVFINELVLNAPDFPVAEFVRLAPEVRQAARRVTLYCSYRDTALQASETYNSGRRMGTCESVPGVDVINVGDIDNAALGGSLGHSYYASRPVLTDVFQLLLGIEAERRLFIRRSEPNSVEAFFLRP